MGDLVNGQRAAIGPKWGRPQGSLVCLISSNLNTGPCNLLVADDLIIAFLLKLDGVTFILSFVYIPPSTPSLMVQSWNHLGEIADGSFPRDSFHINR